MKEYLDKSFVCDQLFSQLLSLKPEFDAEFGKTCQYLADIRNVLYNLKVNLYVDLLAGYIFISHIVVSIFFCLVILVCLLF